MNVARLRSLTTVLTVRFSLLLLFTCFALGAQSQNEKENVLQVANQRNRSKIIFRKGALVRVVKTNREHVAGKLKSIGDSNLVIHKDTIHLHDIRKIVKARAAGRKVLGGIIVGTGVAFVIFSIQTASLGFDISNEFQIMGLVAIASGSALLIERPFSRRKWNYTIEQVDPKFLLATPYQSLR